jgi:hypothetical protein
LSKKICPPGQQPGIKLEKVEHVRHISLLKDFLQRDHNLPVIFSLPSHWWEIPSKSDGTTLTSKSKIVSLCASPSHFSKYILRNPSTQEGHSIVNSTNTQQLRNKGPSPPSSVASTSALPNQKSSLRRSTSPPLNRNRYCNLLSVSIATIWDGKDIFSRRDTKEGRSVSSSRVVDRVVAPKVCSSGSVVRWLVWERENVVEEGEVWRDCRTESLAWKDGSGCCVRGGNGGGYPEYGGFCSPEVGDYDVGVIVFVDL